MNNKVIMFDVIYMIGKKKVETIAYNLPINLARHKKTISEMSGSYSLGTIKIIKNA